MVLVAVSCHPKPALADQVQEAEPPSYQISLEADPPSLTNPVLGKSLNQEAIEKQEEIDRAKAAEKKAALAKIAKQKKAVPVQATTSPTPIVANSGGFSIIGRSNEQCVTYFKRVTGITRSLGYAGSIPIQGNTPRVGAGALERAFGHISLVIEVRPNGVLVSEANYKRGYITQRFLTFSEVRGYIYQ
jgi:hypothetical protein